MDFWQFQWNADVCVIPGKLSEIHLHAWLLSNPGVKVLKSVKSRGQICPILLRRRKNPFPWMGEQPCMSMDIWQLSRNNTYVRIPEKLSEIHLCVLLLSNPGEKVLKSKKKNYLSPWIGEELCMQMDFWQFSRNADICVIPGKLSEIHLHMQSE